MISIANAVDIYILPETGLPWKKKMRVHYKCAEG